jgi:hypothetical protein
MSNDKYVGLSFVVIATQKAMCGDGLQVAQQGPLVMYSFEGCKKCYTDMHELYSELIHHYNVCELCVPLKASQYTLKT